MLQSRIASTLCKSRQSAPGLAPQRSGLRPQSPLLFVRVLLTRHLQLLQQAHIQSELKMFCPATNVWVRECGPRSRRAPTRAVQHSTWRGTADHCHASGTAAAAAVAARHLPSRQLPAAAVHAPATYAGGCHCGRPRHRRQCTQLPRPSPPRPCLQPGASADVSASAPALTAAASAPGAAAAPAAAASGCRRTPRPPRSAISLPALGRRPGLLPVAPQPPRATALPSALDRRLTQLATPPKTRPLQPGAALVVAAAAAAASAAGSSRPRRCRRRRGRLLPPLHPLAVVGYGRPRHGSPRHGRSGSHKRRPLRSCSTCHTL